MKLLLFFLTAALLQVHANSQGQTVTLSGKDLSLKTVFSAITKQTDFNVFTNKAFLKDAKPVSVNVNEMPLEEFLRLVLKDQPLDFRISGKDIILIKKEGKKNEVEVPNAMTAFEPPEIVRGRVVDTSGRAIAGATISVKGSKTVALTNADGNFSIEADLQATLVISAVNIETQEVKVRGRNDLQISAVIRVSELDETIVFAYGQTSKRFSTGGVGTISARDIEKKPVTNVLLALQGEVPGINIQQSSGFANAGIKVRIRGQNSLNNGNDPLYVIDGIPYSSQLMESINGNLGVSGDISNTTFAKTGNPLSFISPADIQSVSVLKDGDATSIYGSRAAAGAVVITTKKGSLGPTKFHVTTQQGWGKVFKFVKLLNRSQYLEMRREAKLNSNQAVLASDYDLNGTWDSTKSTDWQKLLLGNTATYADYQLSSSGGTERTKFLISGAFHRESTVFLTDALNTKGNLHFNLSNTSLNKKFGLQLSVIYMSDNNIIPSAGLASIATSLAPVAPSLFNNDGTLNWAPSTSGSSSWINPLASSKLTGSTKTYNLLGNILLTYKILPGLNFKANMGYTSMQIDETKTTPLGALAPERQQSSNRVGNYSNGSMKSWIIEPQLFYDLKRRKGKLELLIGTTIQRNNNNQQVFEGKGYTSDQLLNDIRSASSIQVTSTTAATYRYNALFGSLNYRYDNRYIISLTARRDGSSRFGSNNLFHNFASASAAWLFSEEALLNRIFPFISFGKLQSSIGTTGNDQIGDYQFLNLFLSNTPAVPYQGISGLQSVGLPNPNIQWEQTKKLQFSIDLGFLKDRILLNVTYFRNRSSNQLVGYILPSLTGFNSYTRNLPATIQNMGWEVSLNLNTVKGKDIDWSTRLNFYIPKNKLIAFPELNNSSYSSQYRIGEPITSVRVYSLAGVGRETGLYQFYDYKGQLTSNPSSATDQKLLNVSPIYSGGVTNTFKYKQLQLDVLLQYNRQYIQGIKYGALLPGAGSNTNQPITILSRWRKQGDVTDIEQYSSSTRSAAYTAWAKVTNSDANYIDCNMFRVKNVSLSWQFPGNWSKKVKLQSCQIFAHAENLFTFSNYVGPDPETGLGALPPLKVFTVGLQASF